MLKRTLLVCLTFLMAFSVVLISLPNNASAQSAPTNTPAPTATTVVHDSGSGGTQINFWNGLTGGDGDTMAKIVDQFAKENPDISVHTESYDWNTMYQKLQAAFVAGEPPDVFIVHLSNVAQFASLGILAPSDDMLDTNGGPLPAKDFVEPAFDKTVVDGKHYGILWDNHGFGTWVNLNLFQKAGVDPNTPAPTTADDFVKLATKLTMDTNGKHPDDPAFDVKNVAQWGTGIDWVRVQFEAWMYQFGGDTISADGKTATINSPQAQSALQFMYDMIYKYHIAPDPASTNGYNAFQAQKIAIMPSGTWFHDVLSVQHPEIKWTAWPMIQIGPNPGTWVDAHEFFLPASAQAGPKTDAAKKFIVWMSNHNDLWAASGHVPARISLQNQLDPTKYLANQVFGKGFQTAGHFEPQNVNIIEIQNAYDPIVNAVLNNQMSVKDGLDKANTAIQAIIDRGGN